MKTDDTLDTNNPEMAASGRTQENTARGKTIGEFGWREAGAVSAVGQNECVDVLGGHREIWRTKTRARRGVGAVRVIRQGKRGRTRDYLHQRGPWGALERRALQEQLKTAIAAAQRLAETEMTVELTVGKRVWPDERRWTEEQAG